MRATPYRTLDRRLHVVEILLLAVALAACARSAPRAIQFAPAPSAPPAVTLERATIVTILDADSIEMRLDDGRDLHVQLLGIDAPDAGLPLRGHANEFVRSKLTKGRRVYLEHGPQLWDDHNRYLSYVWLKRPSRGTLRETSGNMLNAMMLIAGYAEVETEDENPKYETLFRQLERNAKRAGKGIWA